MDLRSFLAELKRRRVLRVAGAYAVVAWVVVQVASVFVPALDLDGGIVTAVAVLAILGFPVAVVLAWAFDLHPDRGDVLPAASAASATLPRWAYGALLVAVLGTAGWFAVVRRGHDVALDPDAVMIVPFRVAGDPSMAYLREGMVDLLTAQFTGVGGPAAVDSRTALRAWRDAVEEDPAQDLSAEQARSLARELGAGQVLLGEVVVAPGTVTLQASVYSTVDGDVLLRTEPQRGAPDSLVVLVERLAAELLGRTAGVDREQLPMLSTFSVEAVRSYLAGQVEYRGGRMEEAAEHFAAAVQVDSTFALAALGLTQARSWAGYGPQYYLGRRLAWQHRDRLPPRDSEYLVAYLGEHWPRPRSAVAELRGWNDYLEKYPDRPEGWYELADRYFHHGAIAGHADALERARNAFERSLKVDSTFEPARAHLLELHALRRDTASLRREATRLFAAAPALRTGHYGWLLAAVTQDTAALRAIRAGMSEWNETDLLQLRTYAQLYGVPEDALRADELRRKLAASPQLEGFRHIEGAWVALNFGQPRRAKQLLQAGARAANDPSLLRFLLVSSNYPDADTAGMGALRTELLRLLPRPGVPPTEVAADYCFLSVAVQSGPEPPTAHLAKFRSAVAADTTKNWEACLRWAELLDADRRNAAAEIPVALARLDSLLQHEYVQTNLREVAGYTSAQFHARRGDWEGALRALHTRDHYANYMLAPALIARARVRAQLGDRDGAVQDYLQFLAMRPDPEPGPAAELNAAARRELGQLAGERTR